ncbi:hypothetical protein QQX98_005619 [Neonectria punicea]|uniref:Uncharacterized protein n=1 Tax=Neonectria punicea TaxID=979145 RepID=A0ABR1H4D4_9HYPO
MDLPSPRLDDVTASALPLPPLRILLKQETLEITVTSSFCLDLPIHLSSIGTIDQLLAVVKESHLWIARTGSCCIEVSLAVNGTQVLDGIQRDAFAQSIKKCELWHRLGLRLEYDCDAQTQLPGLMSFSIQHPDLASALAPPTGAATAQFRTLILSINIVEIEAQPQLPSCSSRKNRAKKRKRPHQMKEENTIGAGEQEDMSSALDLDDRWAVESFISSLNFPSQGTGRHQSIQSHETEPKLVIEEVLNKVNNSALVAVMFEQLMLAPAKKFKGIQIVGGLSSRCLTRLAPGVFHIPYLKTVSDRLGFLKVISTSLSRMRNAESRGLRQKVTGLGLRNTQGRTDEWKNITQGIEKRAWDVLVTNPKLPPLKEKSKRERRQVVKPTLGSNAAGSFIPMPSEKPEETPCFQVKAEESSSQSMLGIDESVSVNWSALVSEQHQVAESQSFNSTYLDPPASQTIVTYDGFGQLPAPEQHFVGNAWSTDDIEARNYNSDPLFPNNYGFPTYTEEGEQCVGYDPGGFQSFTDWLSCGSPGTGNGI